MNYWVTCRQYCCRRNVIGVSTVFVLLSISSVMFIILISYPQDSTYLVTPDEKMMAKKEIMLLSYGRSGSSFTSGVISYHPNVFFFFEPLHGLEVPVAQNNYFINTQEHLSKKIMKSFFTCNFSVDTIFLFGSKLFNHSNSTFDFHHCLHKMNRPGIEYLLCFYEMLSSCQRHNTVLIKTIRYRVKWTELFLQTRPNFQLILLYRDPRATLYSQSTALKNFNWSQELTNISRLHCQRLEEDLSEAQRLKKLYPDQVKCIRYEDGAMDPLSYTRGIYQFLGLDLNKRIIDYVSNLTNAIGKRTQYRFGIERNAKAAMYKWRYQADFGNVQVIDRTCGHLYPDLGYLKVSSEKDLKSTRPLVDIPPAGKLF